MKKDGAIPAVVSKRNEFRPADELVENALPYLPVQFKHPEFQRWLINYTETVIRSVASHFGVAATRGIEQAAELLCDPEFYATRREGRARQRRQMQEQIAKQEWERIERQNCPTAEQIAQQIKWFEEQITYHQEQLTIDEENLERLRTMTPKNIRLVPSKSVQ